MRKAKLKTKLHVNKNNIIKKSETLIPTLGTHTYYRMPPYLISNKHKSTEIASFLFWGCKVY